MSNWPGFDRRSVFRLAAGAAASLGLAQNLRAQERDRSRTMNLNAQGHRSGVREAARTQNPVLFWNGVALQLVALDHSIDAKDARAPGPCATARALGLVHIVMADAVAAVYPVDYDGFYVKTKAHAKGFPDVFVGGAAAWTLEYIYGAPAHSLLIGSQRLRFLDAYDPAALPAWEAGLAFARNEAFTSRWDWPSIRAAVLATPTLTSPARAATTWIRSTPTRASTAWAGAATLRSIRDLATWPRSGRAILRARTTRSTRATSTRSGGWASTFPKVRRGCKRSVCSGPTTAPGSSARRRASTIRSCGRSPTTTECPSRKWRSRRALQPRHGGRRHRRLGGEVPVQRLAARGRN